MNTQYLAKTPSDDFGFRFSNQIFTTQLSPAAAEQTLTIPSTAPKFKAIIRTSDRRAYVKLNGTATVPVSGPFAPNGSECVGGLMTLCREVNAGDTISVISEINNVEVSIALYEF